MRFFVLLLVLAVFAPFNCAETESAEVSDGDGHVERLLLWPTGSVCTQFPGFCNWLLSMVTQPQEVIREPIIPTQLLHSEKWKKKHPKLLTTKKVQTTTETKEIKPATEAPTTTKPTTIDQKATETSSTEKASSNPNEVPNVPNQIDQSNSTSPSEKVICASFSSFWEWLKDMAAGLPTTTQPPISSEKLEGTPDALEGVVTPKTTMNPRLRGISMTIPVKVAPTVQPFYPNKAPVYKTEPNDSPFESKAPVKWDKNGRPYLVPTAQNQVKSKNTNLRQEIEVGSSTPEGTSTQETTTEVTTDVPPSEPSQEKTTEKLTALSTKNPQDTSSAITTESASSTSTQSSESTPEQSTSESPSSSIPLESSSSASSTEQSTEQTAQQSSTTSEQPTEASSAVPETSSQQPSSTSAPSTKQPISSPSTESTSESLTTSTESQSTSQATTEQSTTLKEDQTSEAPKPTTEPSPTSTSLKEPSTSEATKPTTTDQPSTSVSPTTTNQPPTTQKLNESPQPPLVPSIISPWSLVPPSNQNIPLSIPVMPLWVYQLPWPYYPPPAGVWPFQPPTQISSTTEPPSSTEQPSLSTTIASPSTDAQFESSTAPSATSEKPSTIPEPQDSTTKPSTSTLPPIQWVFPDHIIVPCPDSVQQPQYPPLPWMNPSPPMQQPPINWQNPSPPPQRPFPQQPPLPSPPLQPYPQYPPYYSPVKPPAMPPISFLPPVNHRPILPPIGDITLIKPPRQGYPGRLRSWFPTHHGQPFAWQYVSQDNQQPEEVSELPQLPQELEPNILSLPYAPDISPPPPPPEVPGFFRSACFQKMPLRSSQFLKQVIKDQSILSSEEVQDSEEKEDDLTSILPVSPENEEWLSKNDPSKKDEKETEKTDQVISALNLSTPVPWQTFVKPVLLWLQNVIQSLPDSSKSRVFVGEKGGIGWFPHIPHGSFAGKPPTKDIPASNQ